MDKAAAIRSEIALCIEVARRHGYEGSDAAYVLTDADVESIRDAIDCTTSEIADARG